MKNYTNIFLCLFLASLSGCYKMRGQIMSSTKIVRTPLDTTTKERVISGKEQVRIIPEFDGDNLVVKATQTQICVDDVVRTYDRTDYVTRRLPLRYRPYLTAGLVLTGAGGLLTSLGAVGMTREYPGGLGDFQQEEKNDKVTAFATAGMVIGSAIGSVGIMMLISSIADAAASKDEVIKRKPESVATVSPERPCNESPASKTTLQFVNGLPSNLTDSKIPQFTSRTALSGAVRIAILNNHKLDGFKFSKTFMTVSCEQCEPALVTLPPELSAKLVVAHNEYDELKDWLSIYPRESSSETVRRAYSKLEEERQVKEQERQSRLEKECAEGERPACAEVEKLRGYYTRDCKRNAESCFELAEMYQNGTEGPVDMNLAVKLFNTACKRKIGDACTALGRMRQNGEGGRIDRKSAQRYYKLGCSFDDDQGCRAQTKLLEEIEAENEAARLFAEKASRKRALEAQMASLGIKLGGVPEHVMDMHVQQEGDGFFIYFILVDENRNQTVTNGSIALDIDMVTRDEFVVSACEHLVFKVAESDFEVASVGKGVFGRSALLYRTPFIKWSSLYVFGGYSAKNYLANVSSYRLRANLTVQTDAGQLMQATEHFRP